MREATAVRGSGRPAGVRLLAVVSLMAMIALAGPAADQAAADGKKPPRVTIRTTEYGIPRILADSWRGLGYGYGFAIAKDQLCTLADTYVTVRGERSRFFGGAADAPDNFTNLQSDFYWKRVRAEGTVKKLLAKKPPHGPKPQIRKAMRGYVAGYNAYLKRTGIDTLPDPRCRGEEWVRPITLSDAFHRFYQLLGLASSQPSLDGIVEAQPPLSGASAEGSAPDPAAGITPGDFEGMKPFAAGLGSNAVGLGSQGTASRKGLLLGNPHFPWHGSERFFQTQMTIPGKVNVSGASLLGVPLELIGHTRNLAWSHTVSTARRFVVFQEKLVPGQPTKYIVDGRQKEMKRTTVTVKDKDGPDRTRTLYATDNGMMVNSIQGTPLFGWTPSWGYSLYDANAQNFRMINHFFDVNRAQSTPALLKILKKYQGIPWVNTIAADSKGRALYADIGSVPNAPDSRVARCNTGIGAISWPSFRLAVFDGSRSECGMKTRVKGAAAPGILPASAQPRQQRRDYVENSNDSYWLTNVKKPLEGFDRIIGEERIAQTERTRVGHKMVNEVLSRGRFSLAKLKRMMFNNRIGSAEVLLDPLVAYCRSTPIMLGSGGLVDVSQACEVLSRWDGRNNLDSRGGVLFQRFIEKAFTSLGSVYASPFVHSDPIGSPSGINTANPDVSKALADAVTEFETEEIPLDARLGDFQFVVRNGKKIPIHGGEFEPYGAFNAVTGFWLFGFGVPEIVHGSSFIMAADMRGKKCPKVSTILTYSQSENPRSRHHADQTRLYSKKRWVTDRFCPRQQKRSPGLKVKKFGGGAKAARRGW